MTPADSSLDTSELKKQIAEQTSKLPEASEVEEETAEIEEKVEETTESEESTEEKTSEEKEETTEEKPKKKDELHKIIIEGKEELMPYEKLVEFAQKGRFLEKERAKDKAEREKRSAALPPNLPMGDFSKINDEFVEKLQKNALGTMAEFVNTALIINKEQEKEEKRVERSFIQEKTELPYYKEVKPIYDELRDYGHTRDVAWAMAEADFWREYAVKAMDKGKKDTLKKVNLQKKADIPLGEKKTKESKGTLPTPDELKKSSSADIKKYLKYTRNPGW